MLSPSSFASFIENLSPTIKGQSWTVDLPEDDVSALTVVFDIVHSRFDRVPAVIPTINECFNICDVVDKYGMEAALRPWAASWLKKLEYPEIGDERRLWIGWVLGDSELFTSTVSHLIRTRTVERGHLKLSNSFTKEQSVFIESTSIVGKQIGTLGRCRIFIR